MPSIEELPQELFDHVTSYLSRRDCKSLRLVSSQFADATISGLVHEVHLSLHPQSWRSLHKIASNPKFAEHVKSLVVFPNILPRFDGYSGWLSCIDSFALKQRLNKRRNRSPLSEALYRKYGEYNEAVAIQQQMLLHPRFPQMLQNTRQSFCGLRKMKAAMWSDGWRSVPTPDNFGGKICNFDDFWNLLKPQEPFEYSDGSWRELWLSRNEHEQSSMFRSSIIQSRLICATLLIPLLGTISDTGRHIIELDLYMSADAIDEDYGNFIASVEEEGSPSDETMYGATTSTCLQTLRVSSAPQLEVLAVHIQEGNDGLVWDLLDGLRVFLNSAKSLRKFALHLNSGNDGGQNDMLEEVADAYAPSLCSLHLTGADYIVTTEATLRKLMEKYREGLKTLSLHDIYFTRGYWRGVLRDLPGLFSLECASIVNLVDEHHDQVGVFSEPYLCNRKARGFKALHDYILRQPGAAWPGWTEDVYY